MGHNIEMISMELCQYRGAKILKPIGFRVIIFDFTFIVLKKVHNAIIVRGATLVSLMIEPFLLFLVDSYH